MILFIILNTNLPESYQIQMKQKKKKHKKTSSTLD